MTSLDASTLDFDLPAGTSGDSVRVELGRLVALIGVAGVAIAQPVLDSFGKSPETFVYRDAEGIDLVLFGLAVVLVPPLAVWWIGTVVGMVAPRWRMVVHGASIGAFVGLAAVQVLSGSARPLAVAVSVAAAIGAWVLTVRSGAFRLWSEFLAVLPVFALVVFLFASPSSDVVSEGDFAAAAASRGPVAPVVLIVLDELPTASIIDDAGAIDPVRFPNLARLAGEATWYRNHTTQSGFTNTAVPTIFTGRSPTPVAPLFTRQPDNIFRLLAGSHDLVVSEALTRLCPTAVCGETPQAPPAAGADGEVDDEGDEAGPQVRGLFGDALDLWVERVTGSDEPPSLDDFEEVVESAPSASASSFGAGEVPTDQGTWQEAVATQPSRLTDFLSALQPGARPLAGVLHLVSPHYPWRYLSDGRTYADPADAADLPLNGGGDPWVANLERQRHLLQASYTDRLVGQILQRLEEVGVYDDAAIVVTADHGIAFSAAEERRVPVTEAMPEIMWTPLIVKAPGQTEARVDDANVQSIDVLPTIASLIGVEIPWEVDGLDLTSADLAPRGDRKRFWWFDDRADATLAEGREVASTDRFTTMLGMAFPAVGVEDDPVTALYRLSGRGELVGQDYQPTDEVSRNAIVVDDRDRLVEADEPVVVLTGTVDGDRGAEHVVAVVEGRIVAVSPVVQRADGGAAFALLLPTNPTVDLGEVQLGLVRGSEILDVGSIG